MSQNTNYINHNSKKGFTLIEIMIVVVLISILTGLVYGVLNISGIRAKARDSQRKSDLAKIRSSLELYFTTNRSYPLSGGAFIDIGTSINTVRTALEGTYIDRLPNDPSYAVSVASPCNLNGGGSSDTDYRYNYRAQNVGNFYLLTAIMEVSTSNDDGACVSMTNWSANCGLGACGCGGEFNSSDYCYGVQNPF